MTNEEIRARFEKKYPEFTLTEISRMPWGAYIYAVNNKTNRKVSFSIDF